MTEETEREPEPAEKFVAHESAEAAVEQGCPTPTAHARLREAHKYWHDALVGYQDPEVFRVALNACIQALRSTTFVLQSEGGLIPDFDEWYEPWRDRFKSDPIMRWLVRARNRIVHAGDLETRSRATVRFVLNYQAAAAEVVDGLVRSERPLSPSDSRQQADDSSEPQAEASSPLLTLAGIVQEFVENESIPKRQKDQASLSVERSWIAEDLADTELLDALAHGYGQLALMLEDAHRLVNWVSGTAATTGEGHVLLPHNPLFAGRLPCMVTSRAQRTIVLGPTGQVAEGLMHDAEPVTAEQARKAAKRYKSRRVRLPAPPMNAIDHMPILLEHALSILKSGDEHGWFLIYFKGRQQIHTQTLAAQDRAEKRVLAQRAAELVALNGVDGIVEIGEVWTSDVKKDEDGVPIAPTDRPERTEGLMLHAELASGETKTLLVPFRRRRFSGPVIGDPVESEAESQFLAPVRAVWGVMFPNETSEDSEDSTT